MSANSAPETSRVGDLAQALYSLHGAGQVIVILPALNEVEAIGHVLDRIPRGKLKGEGYGLSVWVIDGKSMDGTRDVALNSGAGVLVQRGNGKGYGMAQAFDFLIDTQPEEGSAVKRYYIMLDSDGTYPPEAIPRFLRTLQSGYDVVMGSRFLGSVEEGALTPLNRIGNIFLTGFARLLYWVPVTDVCTGMWGFTEEFLRRFVSTANGFDLEADIFASACDGVTRIAEVPITYRQRIGKPKLVPIRTGLAIAWRLLTKRVQRTGGPLPKGVREERSLTEVTP